MFRGIISGLFCRFVFRSSKRSRCWCSLHWTATTSAASRTGRQEAERRTPWRERSLTSPGVSFPELCSKSSKQQRSWEHKAGRLVCVSVLFMSTYRKETSALKINSVQYFPGKKLLKDLYFFPFSVHLHSELCWNLQWDPAGSPLHRQGKQEAWARDPKVE